MRAPLLDLAKMAVDRAIEIGASESEAYFSLGSGYQVSIEKDGISSESRKTNSGLGVRVYVGKSLGFGYTNDPSRAAVGEAVKRAVQIARANKENPNWAGLPAPAPYTEVGGLLDPEIRDLQAERIIEMAGTMLEAAHNYDERVVVMFGTVEAGHSIWGLVNSLGVQGSEEGTHITAMIGPMAKENGVIGSFASEFESSRRLEIDVERIGREGAKKAVECLGAKSVDNFKGTVIFDFEPVTFPLLTVLSMGVNGDWVRRQKTPLVGKIGEQVGAEGLNVVDDGLLEGGLASSSFDDEGFPCQRTEIMSRGVLRSYLHNSYTANVLAQENTGNASSGFSSVPHVGPTNLIVSPGDERMDELIGGVKRGLLVKRFSGTPFYETGDVSGAVKQSFYVEDGEIRFPVEEVMISGNVYELIKNISAISKERRTLSNVICPAIRSENVQVVGKG